MSEGEKGTAKWFKRNGGYGSAEGVKGADVSVHYSHIRGEGFRNQSMPAEEPALFLSKRRGDGQTQYAPKGGDTG